MIFYFVTLTFFFLGYFIFIRQKFDLYFLLYISSVIYFMPGFFGYVWYKDLYSDVNIGIVDKTYYIFIIVQFSFLIFSFINDQITFKVRTVKIKEYSALLSYKYLVIINTILMLLSLYSIEFNIFASRDILLASYGFSYTLWTYSSILSFVVSWIYKKNSNTYFLLSLINILMIFFLGDRTSLLIGALAICMYEFWNKDLGKLVKNNKFKIIMALFVVVLGFMSKGVYSYIRLGEYSLALKYILQKQNYIDAFVKSEPFITQMILNHFVMNDINVNIEYMRDLKYQIFPNPSSFKEYESMSDILQNYIFPNVHYGLAGNIWAEMYNFGGYLGIILFLLLINIFILLLNNLYNCSDKFFKGFILVIGTISSFYIHRNFLESYLTMLRLSTLLILLSIFVGIIIGLMRKKGESL